MESLSKAEIKVIALSSQDKSAGEIAAILNKSTFTIQAQIKEAKRKLNVNTIQGAVGKYLQSNKVLLFIAILIAYIFLKSTEIPQAIADTNLILK